MLSIWYCGQILNTYSNSTLIVSTYFFSANVLMDYAAYICPPSLLLFFPQPVCTLFASRQLSAVFCNKPLSKGSGVHGIHWCCGEEISSKDIHRAQRRLKVCFHWRIPRLLHATLTLLRCVYVCVWCAHFSLTQSSSPTHTWFYICSLLLYKII